MSDRESSRDDSTDSEDGISIKVIGGRYAAVEARKRKQFKNALLSFVVCAIIGTVAILFVMLTSDGSNYSHNNSNDNNHIHNNDDNDDGNTTWKIDHCHYWDSIYPGDQECGVEKCIANNIKRGFRLQHAWNSDSLSLRNESAIEMLDYIAINYNADGNISTSGDYFPSSLEILNNSLKMNQTMIYNNEIDIALSGVHMSIEYFCCYNDSEYETIKQLFNTWEMEGESFSLSFDSYLCLNLTESNLTVYVLLLDQSSQELMCNFTDLFEDYLVSNGIRLKSQARRYGQPFHTTFAIFDRYDENLETMSVDTINYLNSKYLTLWQEPGLAFEFDQKKIVMD